MAELEDFKKLLKPLQDRADEQIAEVASLNTNIGQHRNQLEGLGRGLGEAMQKIRSGKAKPDEADTIMAEAKIRMKAMETCETAMAKLEKASKALKDMLDELETKITKVTKANPKHAQVSDLDKLATTVSRLGNRLMTEVIKGTESGFKASKHITSYETELATYLKLSAADAATQAQEAELRDRLPMLFNRRHIAVRKADMVNAVAAANKAVAEAGEALSASKAGLMSKPPIIAIADIKGDLATALKALKTIKDIFAEYGTGMADLARNKNMQKEFMASDEGKIAASILKAGHEAQESVPKEMKSLQKTADDLATVAEKLAEKIAAARKAKKEEERREAESKAAQRAEFAKEQAAKDKT